MKRKITTFYWMQLLALASVHFVVDLFSGMPPAILPAIRDEFTLSLSRGGFVLVAIYLTCNGVQVLTGHMRSGKRRPLLLHLGLLLAAGVCLIGLLPRGRDAYPAMLFLAVVSGIGIALVHPEGLRGVHRLKRISPAVSTAVFMAGGFLGYASGGAVSAFLVSRFGFRGLYPLVIFSVVSIVTVLLLRIRLAVEPRTPNQTEIRVKNKVRLPFWFIFIMAMPAAVSTTILAVLVPTVLNELGFELTFGGYSTTLFGLGGAAGSFIWAWMARKKGELVCTIATLFLTLPFLLAYLVWIEKRAAIWILLGTGFCTVSAYTLMITLSRHAIGSTIGQRMGVMVGGTWALAYIIFQSLLLAAEHFQFGTRALLNLTPWGYLFSGLFGVFVMLKKHRTTSVKTPG